MNLRWRLGARVGIGVLVAAMLLISGDRPLQPQLAHARVSLAQSLDRLVFDTPVGVVAKVLSRKSRWEQRGGKRIVSYTKVALEQTVYGRAPKVAWITTLGGAVGEIGQHVAGEPQLRVGERALLFLQPFASEFEGHPVFRVTAAAQGHFPIIQVTPKGSDKAVERLAASPSRGKLIAQPGPSIAAAEVLVGHTLPQALSAIRDARKRWQDAQK